MSLMRDKTEAATKKHRQILAAMQTELARVDSRWKDEEQQKARADIRKKYQEQLNEVNREITNLRKEIHGIRKAESDPMLVLFRRGLNQADTVSVGFQGMLDAMDVLSTDAILTLCDEYANPALTATAWQIIRERDLKGDALKSSEQRLFKSAYQFIDAEKIKTAAGCEAALVEETLSGMKTLKEMGFKRPEPTKNLELSHEIEELKRIARSDPREAPIPRGFDANPEPDGDE